jgi:signal transduction histidine kinase
MTNREQPLLRRRVIVSPDGVLSPANEALGEPEQPIARILLVEDQDLDARLVDMALRRPVESSFEIFRARTLSAALEMCATRDPELVLLDLSLPDADGLISLRRINEAFPALPIIVLSANTEMELAVEALENGAEDYLYKDDFNQKILKRSILYSLERNRSKQKLLEIERRMQEILRMESLGTLAGGIAHEFNNALTAVMGNITMLAAEAGAGTETEQLLHGAVSSLERARHLSHQLLALSRKGALEVTPVSARDLLEHALRYTRNSPDYPVTTLMPDDLWPALVDEYLILNVLHSVLENAMEAMNWQGEIRVEARNLALEDGIGGPPIQPGNYVIISIADQGPGIPAKMLPRVFEPYFTTHGEGRGLGLANALAIMRQHGGWLSLGPGHEGGTVATLFLPAAPPEARQKSSARTAEVVPGSGRVLLMDDDAAVQKSVSYMLRKLGYEVAVAEEGARALEIFLEERAAGRPFDLLVLDLTVPSGMGGRELIGRILEVDPEARAIVSSGYSDDDVLIRHSAYGFKAKLPKPFTFGQLSAVVAEVRAAV